MNVQSIVRSLANIVCVQSRDDWTMDKTPSKDNIIIFK